MKVTAIWVYPIKSLRGIRLDKAHLGPQGIQHDRRFMLCRVGEAGELTKIQLSQCPECSLFAQDIVDDAVHVHYLTPKQPLVPPCPQQDIVLEVPLNPDTAQLQRAAVNLHQSMVNAYRMGSPYDEWFSACFGFNIALLYIGDERRPVLGSFSPRNPPFTTAQNGGGEGWLSTLSSYIWGAASQPEPEPDWLTFSDMAPYLVTTEQSLRNVSARLTSGPMEMFKFRPNIVVDGEGGEFDEDFWTELSISGAPALTMTKLCNRCVSLNVDYETGRVAEGERGAVLKKLMADRRVDPGFKWAPCFGKYGFLADGRDALELAVGDEVAVTGRSTERPPWDWPMKAKEHARFYRYA